MTKKSDTKELPRYKIGDKFCGFDDKFHAYWMKFPHEIIDCFAQDLSGSELKVILFIIRWTWGMSKGGETGMTCISYDEFLNGKKNKDGARESNGLGLSLSAINRQ